MHPAPRLRRIWHGLLATCTSVRGLSLFMQGRMRDMQGSASAEKGGRAASRLNEKYIAMTLKTCRQFLRSVEFLATLKSRVSESGLTSL